ncbi:hypothetical protein OKW30_007598 [Paraburkholderia sp. Clong3]|nr:hypothetical protein [Paraburkholderia sp. CI2]
MEFQIREIDHVVIRAADLDSRPGFTAMCLVAVWKRNRRISGSSSYTPGTR